MKGNLTIFTMSLKYYTSLLNSISNNYLKCETEERKPLFLFFLGVFWLACKASAAKTRVLTFGLPGNSQETSFKMKLRDFPGGSVVKTPHFHYKAGIGSLIREPRSYMPCGVAKSY